MVRFVNGRIYLLRKCSSPVTVSLSPLFQGAILQTSQLSLGYINISSKTHIIQGLVLLIFLLELLFNSLFCCYYCHWWVLANTFCCGYLEVRPHRQGSSQCAQSIWPSLLCHIRSFLRYSVVVLLILQGAMLLLQGHLDSPIPTSN